MTAVVAVDVPEDVRSTVAARRIAASNEVAERFFRDHADAIAQTCQAMAARFERGGRLLICGDDAQRSDVAHVVVEFVHPVVVGKRALTALSLPAVANGAAQRVLSIVRRPDDMLMLLTAGALDGPAQALLRMARDAGMLTLALTSDATNAVSRATDDHVFAVPSTDPYIVQETHEMLYHVLWELVHVFFDHRPRSRNT